VAGIIMNDGPGDIGRRRFLASLAISPLANAGLHHAGAWLGGWAGSSELGGKGSGPQEPDPIIEGRPLVRYPEKTDLLLLTSRPPQLETPLKYFHRAITPNDASYVRYHLFPIPTSVDLKTWRLKVTGKIEHTLDLSMDDLQRGFEPAKVVAVNQCSGNGRGYSDPRVFGGQWGNGAVGNAEWKGVSLRDILARAGVRQGAVQVTFNGLDAPAAPSVPDFVKSLDLSRVMDDPDLLVAYEMNGEPLPMLNGFPARLVVPGWYATYWVKHLAEISVIDHEFDGFWMAKAYRIPDTGNGFIEPGTTPARTVPISRMNVRSLIASPESGARVRAAHEVKLLGVAFDGGTGIRDVVVTADEGRSWRPAKLGADLGRYSFREWSFAWTPQRPGRYRLAVRAINRIGESQPMEPQWNPSGYMRNVAADVELTAV
jgi:sulfite dehydrogenase (cytochrome) subunit A